MSTKQALIVDDSTTAQYRLKKMLRQYDLNIDVVDSGEDALRYLSHSTPDVVFMDHLMPGMDGLEALQIIKSHPETATVPVIMYTSKSGDVYTGQARALGALDVVSKDTINAADLGVVLDKLNVEANADKTKGKAVTEDSDTTVDSSSGDITGLADPDQKTPATEEYKRRSSDKKRQAEARNMELRISHLEKTLEENRRFISARVVRELQSHRHKTKRDVTTQIEKSLNALNEKNKKNIVTPQEIIAGIEESRPNDARPSFIIVLVCIIAILNIIFYLQNQNITSSIAQNQKDIRDQIAALPLGTAQPNALTTSQQETNLEVQSYFSQESYLNDLTWAFNQSGRYVFFEEQFDASALVRLTEFFAILNRNNFKGVAIIKISLGDYCLNVTEFGQMELAPDTVSTQDCVLLSEASSVEGIIDVYVQNIQSALSVFYTTDNGSRELAFQAINAPVDYPQRDITQKAKRWNDIAKKNTFVSVELVPDLVLPSN